MALPSFARLSLRAPSTDDFLDDKDLPEDFLTMLEDRLPPRKVQCFTFDMNWKFQKMENSKVMVKLHIGESTAWPMEFMQEFVEAWAKAFTDAVKKHSQMEIGEVSSKTMKTHQMNLLDDWREVALTTVDASAYLSPGDDEIIPQLQEFCVSCFDAYSKETGLIEVENNDNIPREKYTVVSGKPGSLEEPFEFKFGAKFCLPGRPNALRRIAKVFHTMPTRPGASLRKGPLFPTS